MVGRAHPTTGDSWRVLLMPKLEEFMFSFVWIVLGVSIVFRRVWFERKFQQYVDFGPFHVLIGLIIAGTGCWSYCRLMRIRKRELPKEEGKKGKDS
jgi:type VI protein secretion system component VasK